MSDNDNVQCVWGAPSPSEHSSEVTPRQENRPVEECKNSDAVAASRIRESLLKTVSDNGHNLRDLSAASRADRKIVGAAVKKHGRALKYADPDLADDREIVSIAVGSDPVAIKYASHRLQCDIGIVRLALFGSEFAKFYRPWGSGRPSRENEMFSVYKCLDETMKRNKEIIIGIIKSDASILHMTPPECRSNEEIVLESVRQYGSSLASASENLRANPVIVFVAVSQNGYSLRYASEELKKNRDLALLAVSRSNYAMEYVSEDLRKDTKFVNEAIDRNPENLACCLRVCNFSSDVQKTLTIRALPKCPHQYPYLPPDLLSDTDVVDALLRADGKSLKLVPSRFQDEKEMVLRAIRQCPLALEHASARMRGDLDVVRTAVMRNGRALKFALPEVLENKKFIIQIVEILDDICTAGSFAAYEERMSGGRDC